MPSTVNTPAWEGGTTTTGRTFNKTVATTGNSGVLLIEFGDSGSTVDGSGVSIGGAAATHIGSVGAGAAHTIQAYIITGLTAGVNAVSYTFGASAENWYMWIELDSDVNQSTPIRTSSFQSASNAAFTTGLQLSLTVPSDTGDLVIAALAGNGTTLHTRGGSQTLIADANDSDVKQSSRMVGASPSVNPTYTSASGAGVLTRMVAFSIQPAAASSSAIKTVNGLAEASVKTVYELANASVKTINGLA